MAIESTDFPPCSKTYVALKSRFIHSSHQLTANLDLFLLFLLFAFYLFIYLGSNVNRLSSGRVYIEAVSRANDGNELRKK